MSGRTDRKLVQVPVARFGYRHEAEFAAGFLDEAGIPYRLELDDPAIGISFGMTATIWVRGADLHHAREVLELDEAHRTPGPSMPDPARERASAGSGPITPAAPRAPGPAPSVRAHGRSAVPDGLAVRERGLALGGAVAIAATDALFLTGPMHPIVDILLLSSAAGLALAGIAGRAPGFLRRVLRALSGEAP